jgi:hypothetical protein
MSQRTSRLIVTAAATVTSLVAAEASANTRWTDEFSPANGGWNRALHVRGTGDFDGDGRQDLIGFGDAAVFVARSTGRGFAPAKQWLTGMTVYNGGWSALHHPRVAGDVDGDGKDDLVGFADWGVLVARSSGSGFEAALPKLAAFGYGNGWRGDRHVRRIADVNGDGRADIVGFGETAVFVSFSTGTGFTAPVVVSNQFVIGNGGWNPERHPRFIADVDGDGDGDIVGFAEGGVLVGLWTGSNFAPLTAWAADFSPVQGWVSQSDFPRSLADVDGDGRADVVGHGYWGTIVARSTGSGFAVGNIGATDLNLQSGWGPEYPRVAADVSGDGKADILGWASDGVRVMVGDGDGFVDEFEDFGGADYVSRLVSTGSGLCLFATGDGYVRQEACEDRAVSWVLDAQDDDGSFMLRTGDRCVYAVDSGSEMEAVWASAQGCGLAGNRWRLERTSEGRLRVRNQDNDLCLGVGQPAPIAGNTVIAQPCVGSAYQMWSPDTLRAQQMQAKLRLRHSERCLWAPANQTHTVQWTCQDAPEQDLVLTDQGDGGYTIQSGGNEMCLGIEGASQAPGAWIRQQPCDGGRHQRWTFGPHAEGGYALISMHTGQCADIAGGEMGDGGVLLQWGCHGGLNQRFDLIDLRSTAAMTTSLQNVGSPEGTALVIANETGGYLTHDPQAILRAVKMSGQQVDDDLIHRVLSPLQQQKLAELGGAWDNGAADLNVEFKMFTLYTDAELSQHGVTLGGNAKFVPAVGISGKVRLDARYISGDVSFKFGKDGLAIKGANVNTPIASGGFSVNFFQAPTDFDFELYDGSRVGFAVALGGLNLHFSIDVENSAQLVAYVEYGADYLADGATEAFNSVTSWSEGALETVEDTLGDVLDALEDVGEDVEDFFCGIFGC